MRTRRRLLLWAPVVLLLAYEFFLSSRPPSSLPPLGPWFEGKDKVEHALYFFLTGLLAVRAARVGERWSEGKTAMLLILGAALWGCSDEIHQSYTPGRSVEVGDVVADVAGVVVAVGAGQKLLRSTGLHRAV